MVESTHLIKGAGQVGIFTPAYLGDEWRNWYTCLPAGRRARLKNMYYFYTIRSTVNGSLYKGISSNPAKRLTEHNSGKTKSTKHYRPYEIVYLEKCSSREIARKKEKYYKSGIGREKLKNLIN